MAGKALKLDNGKVRTANIEAARATITLTHNGNLNNNAWLGYTQSIPSNDSPILIPWNSKLVEVAFSNRRTSVDGNLEFFLNGTAPGDIFRTWAFVNVNRVQSLVGISDSFSAGDLLALRWDDQGQNPNDVGINLFFVLDS